jgi:hypothetical protein
MQIIPLQMDITFLAPMNSENGTGYVAIIDRFGTPVYYRKVVSYVSSFTIQPNGYLSYTLKYQNFVSYYMMDSSFVLIDSLKAIVFPTDEHDFIAMENGHYLLLGIDTRTMDMSAMVTGGKTDAKVSGCVIQELDQNKNLVFEWNSFNHMQIKDSYADLTSQAFDFTGASSIDIDFDGNILLMCSNMNELTKIKTQTGEVLWRMGGKNNQFIFGDDNMPFSGASDANRATNGNIIVFDNGLYRDNKY